MPRATTDISQEMRMSDTAPCVAVATLLTPCVTARLMVSHTHPTSEPKRCLISPELCRSISAMSWHSSAANKRFLSPPSIATRTSPDTRTSQYFAAASSARKPANSSKGRMGMLPLPPPPRPLRPLPLPPRPPLPTAAAAAAAAGLIRSYSCAMCRIEVILSSAAATVMATVSSSEPFRVSGFKG